jgi:hypothetical protein
MLARTLALFAVFALVPAARATIPFAAVNNQPIQQDRANHRDTETQRKAEK